jgi:D-alanyl-D-alanine carboxypeptidase
MMHMLLASFLLATAAVPAPSAIDAAVQKAIAVNKTPAAQVGVVQDGKLVVDDAFGLANLKEGVAATPQTQFEIGSVTKQFTAAAILQLKEQGKLKLSDPLGKYVPEYSQGKAITIEQLLWQVSGVPNYTEVNHFEHIAGTTPGSLDAALKLIAKKPLEFKPGTHWEYSNTNYLLLGGVIARVSHMPWETYIRTHIFEPAGMTHSGFIQDEPQMLDAATGYQRNKKGVYEVAPRLNGPWAGAAGAIVSTVEDMAKWDEAFYGGKIISPQDVALATAAHRLQNGKSTGYGFGWFIDKKDGLTQIAHSGGTFGFASENDYYPKLREFIIVLASDAGPDPQFIAGKTFDALHPELAALDNTPAAGENPAITALARQWLHMAQTGQVDRSQLTAAFSKDLTPDAIAGAKDALGPMGAPTAFIFRGKTTENGITQYEYKVSFKTAAVKMVIGIDKAGKIAGMGFEPE